MKTLAILMTVFNRKDSTLRCIDNIYNQIPIADYAINIYLTNDGCTDGTPEAVSNSFPQVHIINGNGNLFWNRGMYTAWQEAAKNDYDYYLWLNDDTYVYPDMLSELLKASELNQNEAIIVGATQSEDHHIPTYGGRLYNGVMPKVDGQMKEVKYFNGNIVLIPRHVFKAVGNLDYYFTHSKGDFDYGLRAGELGIKICQVGKFLGACERHEHIDKWCNPNVPLLQRINVLHKPNGMPPKETFHLEKRHYGVMQASFHFVTIYMRCLFPKLWMIKK